MQISQEQVLPNTVQCKAYMHQFRGCREKNVELTSREGTAYVFKLVETALDRVKSTDVAADLWYCLEPHNRANTFK